MIFHPIAVGAASATLVVESALAGSVTVALTASATPGIKIVVSPASYDFGFVGFGQTSAVKTFVATNIGQRDVTMFQSFAPSGCDNYDVLSTTCGSTLAPNASCQADIVFHPDTPIYGTCQLTFLENMVTKADLWLHGQTSF